MTSCTGNVQGGGCLGMSKRVCLSIFRRVDDVTKAMSKGGDGAGECLHPPPPFQEILYPLGRLVIGTFWPWDVD